MPECLRSTTKHSLLSIFWVPFLSGLLLAGEQAPISYKVEVVVEPSLGTIAVRAKLQIPIKSKSKEFTFRLCRTFAITQLAIHGKKLSYSVHAADPGPMTPAANNVIVSLPRNLDTQAVLMDIAYRGHLKDIPEWNTFPDQKLALDDQINSHLVELAGYSSWHPVFVSGEPIRVDELALSLPFGWTAICSGAKLDERKTQDRVISRWSSPKDLDIVIVAAPNFKEKSFRQSGVSAEVYYTRLPDEFVAREGQQMAEIVQLYSTLLGRTDIPGGSIRHVYSPKRRGQGKAGFARPGLIVTSEGITLDSLASNPAFSLFQPIAHEVAHFWWNFGAGQGDWINEAFAEYFSALAVQKISSEQEFSAILSDYHSQVADLPTDAPSLANVPFLNDQHGFVVRYYKGSLMLHTLRELMGDEKFFQACYEFFQTYRGQSIGTPEFRNFWYAKLAAHKDFLARWLDSPGGIPKGQEHSGSF